MSLAEQIQDQYDKAEDAVEQEVQRRLPKWQPIESAPKDEEVLLAWFYALENKWLYQVSVAYSTRGGWQHGRATHWQPLLPPSQP